MIHHPYLRHLQQISVLNFHHSVCASGGTSVSYPSSLHSLIQLEPRYSHAMECLHF